MAINICHTLFMESYSLGNRSNHQLVNIIYFIKNLLTKLEILKISLKKLRLPLKVSTMNGNKMKMVMMKSMAAEEYAMI